MHASDSGLVVSWRSLVKYISNNILACLGLVFSQWVGATITLVDNTDSEIVLAQPAQRIVSLAPHITELVFDIGAGDKLVGVVSHSDFPPAALDLPQVGSYKKVSYEIIAALKPDLILAFGSGNGWEMINHLRALGFTVYVDEPKTITDIATTVKNFGVLTGTEKIAASKAQQFLKQAKALTEKYKDMNKVDVFYQVWDDPLFTINDTHLISDVIRLCGGRNIFSDALPLVPKISVEMVVRRNPEVIIASGMGEERPEWLDDWRQWESVNAVKNEQLYFIHPDLLQRHTLRILSGAEKMCAFVDQARAMD
jgi:iron complex transport system substrate-binding protein